MLRPQPRLRAIGADVLDDQLLARDGGQRQRGAQDLPPTLTVRPIDPYHA